MLIPLTQNKSAVVDDEDYERLKNKMWQYSSCGYATAYPGEFMHRVVMNLSKYDGINVDHINGDKLDNRKENLRVCTQAQNIANSKINKSNKSGYKGVYWNKERHKWSTQIKFNRKSMHIGHFVDLEDAAHAYDTKARELFGEFAKTNF